MNNVFQKCQIEESLNYSLDLMKQTIQQRTTSTNLHNLMFQSANDRNFPSIHTVGNNQTVPYSISTDRIQQTTTTTTTTRIFKSRTSARMSAVD